MITVSQLNELYPRARAGYVDAFVAEAPALFEEFGIALLPNRLHFFLAQIGHESGGLSITEENMNYTAKRLMVVWPSRFTTMAIAQQYAGNPEKLGNFVYANRMGNGDPASGDGFLYRGRGFIQITGKEGYREVGARAGIELVAHPDRAASAADALRVACAFWRWKDLNTLCDTGDFTKVTRRINGGTTGMPDRLAWLDKVRRVLAAPPPAAAQPDVETVRAVQRALQARGFASVGAADGHLGPKTAAAIRQFRLQHGMAPGLIDDALLAVFEI